MAKQTKTEQTTEKKAPKAKHLTRDRAANQVVAEMDGSSTLGELAKKADALFVAGGGKGDVKHAAHRVRRALETAEQLGVVKLTRPTDIIVEKAK
jgi:putative intracellular protease/amidase